MFSLIFFSISVYLCQCLQKLCNSEKGLWLYIKCLNSTYLMTGKLEAAQQIQSALWFLTKRPRNILLQVLSNNLSIFLIQRRVVLIISSVGTMLQKDRILYRSNISHRLFWSGKLRVNLVRGGRRILRSVLPFCFVSFFYFFQKKSRCNYMENCKIWTWDPLEQYDWATKEYGNL